jgi:predicted nucleic acid-binding protein
MRVALDTNILVYLAGIGDSAAEKAKTAAAIELVQSLAQSVTIVVPVQAMGELFVVLRRNGLTAAEARTLVLEFAEGAANPPSSTAAMLAAFDLATDHRMQLWDALILCAAAEAGCSILLSEDMQDGFVARGVTVINPLAERLNPKLAALLASD